MADEGSLKSSSFLRRWATLNSGARFYTAFRINTEAHASPDTLTTSDSTVTVLLLGIVYTAFLAMGLSLPLLSLLSSGNR